MLQTVLQKTVSLDAGVITIVLVFLVTLLQDNVGDNELPSTLGDVNVGKNVLHASISVSSSANGLDRFICALTVEGKVRCWGSNINGSLGLNSISGNVCPASTSPTDIPLGGTVVLQISTGLDHTCALFNTGKVKCWGNNNNGQLGLDSLTVYGDSASSIQAIANVNLGVNVVQIDSGQSFYMRKNYRWWCKVLG